MRRKFVVNPRARGVTSHSLAAMKAFFESRGANFDVASCENPARIEATVSSLLEEGTEQIIAVGGDGTIQAAANGFLRAKTRPSSARLAVGRAGTGSDYWRTVSLSRRSVDWREVVLHHEVRNVDVGVLEAQNQQCHFINMASFGWSADVVRLKSLASAKLPAQLAYLWPTVQSLAQRKTPMTRLRIDDEIIEGKLLALFVSKGLYGGGGLRFGDTVALNDGRFDVLLFKDLSLPQILRKFPGLFLNGIEPAAKILRRQARQIEILEPTALPAEIDGELLSQTGPFRLRIEAGALPLCVPQAI